MVSLLLFFFSMVFDATWMAGFLMPLGLVDWFTNTFFQVLAVDLLNPTPQAEGRKHKLKVWPSSAPTRKKKHGTD